MEKIEKLSKDAPERHEDENGKHLKKDKIKSEIQFLKKLKLRADIASSSAGEGIKKIAVFQSQEDLELERIYHNLIEKYQKATEEAADGTKTNKLEYLELQHLYSRFGHDSSLYDMAVRIRDANRKIKDNRSFTEFVFDMGKTKTAFDAAERGKYSF